MTATGWPRRAGVDADGVAVLTLGENVTQSGCRDAGARRTLGASTDAGVAMQLTLEYLSALCVLTTTFAGCTGRAEGQPTAHLEWFDSGGERWLCCTITNRDAGPIVLECEQLIPEIAVDVLYCDGSLAPEPHPPFPVPRSERRYATLESGRTKTIEFPRWMFARRGECRVVRYNYHPSSYPEARAKGALQKNICTNALMLKEDGSCEDYDLPKR
jgi:hypothetical protein